MLFMQIRWIHAYKKQLLCRDVISSADSYLAKIILQWVANIESVIQVWNYTPCLLMFTMIISLPMTRGSANLKYLATSSCVCHNWGSMAATYTQCQYVSSYLSRALTRWLYLQKSSWYIFVGIYYWTQIDLIVTNHSICTYWSVISPTTFLMAGVQTAISRH